MKRNATLGGKRCQGGSARHPFENEARARDPAVEKSRRLSVGVDFDVDVDLDVDRDLDVNGDVDLDVLR